MENPPFLSSSVSPVSFVRTIPRLLWVDFLRGLAVLGMIETHSVNSFLHPLYRTGDWFALLSYINGLVAPTFLFVAGFLQGVSIRKNWSHPKPILPRLRSLGVILLIGYAMQFPWNEILVHDAGSWTRIMSALGKVDVLHCIAVSLAVLLILTKVIKSLRVYDLTIALLTIGMVAAAPFAWNTPTLSSWPGPLLGYFSPGGGALFPLIPWLAFVVGGSLAGRWVNRPVMLGLASLAACAAGWVLKDSFFNWFQTLTYATRYDFYFFRLSLVLLGCTLCAFWLRHSTSPGLVTGGIVWCGRRSLALYFWHLVLLHSGLGIIKPLRDIFPITQTPMTVAGLFFLTLAASLLLTFAGQKIAQRLRSRAR